VRVFRLLRSAQLLRLIPKIQEWAERGMSELALLLWHKRVAHIFRYLDKTTMGKLSAEEMEFFNVAMGMEFPGQDARPGLLERSASGRFGRRVGQMCCRLFSSSSRADSDPMTSRACSTYEHLVHRLLATPVGKRSYRRCFEDIQCMKESCAIVELSISGLTLKVCMLVLMLLITMQVLADGAVDLSISQGISQLDNMARSSELAPDDLCRFAGDEYAKVADDSGLLLLVLDRRLYWTPECRCCNASEVFSNGDLVTTAPCGAASCAEGAEPPDSGSLVGKMLQATGHAWHEHKVVVVEEAGAVRSLALWDVHRAVRASAQTSLVHTCVVVFLLSALLMYFATDFRRLSSSNVLHPLWDLMDDMCTLRSMEILGEAGPLVRGASRNALDDSAADRNGRRWCRCRRSGAVQVSEEITRLRTAFDKLHVAMLSWSKYVPMILLKQLFEARVEANLGCNFEQVCVFFCSISGFKGLAEDMLPTEILGLMSQVLRGIYDALDENGGIMLEFIGDEVLAVFNAPIVIPNYEVAAIASALEAQENVARIEHGDSRIKLACSVHKASVLVGNLGSTTRMKYGVLGDGVNLAARLKSLNSRYGTGILVSRDVLQGEVFDHFVSRPVGNLILKGRTTPTPVFEVLAKSDSCSESLRYAAKKHHEAFRLFTSRRFAESKALLKEAHTLITASEEFRESGSADRLCEHLASLCDQYMASPPPEDWDGSEKLTKKAW